MDDKSKIRNKMLKNLTNINNRGEMGINEYYEKYLTFMPQKVGEVLAQIEEDNLIDLNIFKDELD